MKYAVIGTGGLGGYFGGKLAQHNKDVHFLFHSDYEFVKKNGLKIDSVKGNFVLHPINAYKNTKDIGTVDVVLVCLKTSNNILLKELLPPLLHKNTLILLMQNGLGNEEEVAQYFPENPIAGALAFICTSKVGPGHISHVDLCRLLMAPYVDCDRDVLQQVEQDFSESDVEIAMYADLAGIRWQKLIWNIPFNGMCVVLNTTTDRLMGNSATEKLCYDLMIEVIQAANACGIQQPLSETLADDMLELTRNMTPYAPSMKLDYDFRRPMEIQHMYSNPVKEALKNGYHMKKVEMLEQQLWFIENSLNLEKLIP